MFEGFADELIKLSQYAMNHPITKVVVAVFCVLFFAAIICIISASVRINRTRKHILRRR